MAIELWSRIPPPNSVGTEQLKDGAVTTSKIADGAVTPAKLSGAVRSVFILGDDTEVTETSTTYVEKKRFNFYKDTGIDTLNWIGIELVAELKSSASTYTAYVALFVDNETSPRIELFTNSTSYSVLRGTADISDLATGLHTFSIRCKVSASGGTAYQRHVEIQARR
ncbi:MAG: hypothetical protein LM583_05800 [Desulfurococcaceae archaeon]|nr:hypothetical protein [Desulfurococcaceae archaeon]